MHTYCTYLTTYRGNRLPPFYIGRSTVRKVLAEKYQGSPTSVVWARTFKQERKNNPHLFKTVVLTTHETEKEAAAKEHFFLNFFKASKNPMYNNMHNGGTEFRNTKKGRYSIEELRAKSERVKGEKNPMFGKTWSRERQERMRYNSFGIFNPMFGKSRPKEWREAHSKFMTESNRCSGTIWIHFVGTKDNKRINPGELDIYLKQGWIKGRKFFNGMKKRSMSTCPHCSKTGDSSGMKRYHFDKCMSKPSRTAK